MATWLVLPARTRLGLPSRLWLGARSHLNVALQTPSPASLEIETMPYPTERPDASVFESMSDEYASASSQHQFTPLTSSETLVSLVLRRDFHTAESLRKEMILHHVPIPRNALYLRAALNAITERRPKGSAKARLDTFEAWLSLAPDRREEEQSFHAIRQRLFRSMDHLNLALVYRFGLVLASKGYCSDSAAMQVVSTLARYARPSVVVRYLRRVEDMSRDYYSKTDIQPPLDLLASVYSLAIRTMALGGKRDAALGLISIAQSRGIRVSDFTLDMVAKHASEMNQARALSPSWVQQDATTEAGYKTLPADHSDGIVTLAARLRSLRTSIKSPCPPAPAALYSFITSYQALGRTRALTLLCSLAYRHSPKSASTWAFTEMLHHRSRREPIHVLFVFSRHFHLVGVPRKTLLSLVRGPQGQQARKEPLKRWVVPPFPIKEKLWPSAYHTALVWDAVVSLSSKTDKERLYALLLSLVRQSQRREGSFHEEPDQPKLQVPPNAFDAAHFSPFVSSWARRSPTRAASVLRDMVHLGIEPSMIQWSMVARGYAQHDDPLVALRILDRLEDKGRDVGADDSGRAAGKHSPSDVILGAHTNVLRGFIIAGNVQHAREVELRLIERLGYQTGDRHATDACIALLRDLEDGLSSGSS